MNFVCLIFSVMVGDFPTTETLADWRGLIERLSRTR